MPQMAPIGWLSLFIVFTLTFILFCMMNYYSFLPPSAKTSSSKKNSQDFFNWKW
uniref:ATP synthase complex subunit 8 n=1 Tax=Anthalia sp. YD3030 TaxID=2777027 RepID=A0A7L8XJA0_9MUSC|nr:ATP synthase F0 subunit 8 [Anthalia sp. YD3030]QOH97183.1 ATP synthase F0 subunit 8 [Anthalia sp. YD3030]